MGSGVLLRVESSVFGKPVSATSAESAGLLAGGTSAGARDGQSEFMVGGSKPEFVDLFTLGGGLGVHC